MCRGGPRHGWVYFHAELVEQGEVAKRMGRAPDYAPTADTEAWALDAAHSCRVWAWTDPPQPAGPKPRRRRAPKPANPM